MKIRISSAAYRDLDRGRQFYARQSHSVSVHFLDSLFTDIDSLHRYAGIHAQIGSYRRLLARRFPYAIYYRLVADECVIYRVLDCRRDPGSSAQQLR